MRLLIHCGMVISPGSAPQHQATVVVEGSKILEVVPGYVEEGEAGQVLPWNNYAVIPGMVSCHEHVTLDSVGRELPESDVGPVFALRAVRACREFLDKGVTTVRDAGSKGAINIIIKRALKDGLLAGPDLVVCGHRISRTGFTKWKVCREADGPDSIRNVVRDEHKKGAEFIKLMASGVVSGGGSPYDPQYTYEEVHAAVETAHDLGLKVAVHAYGGIGASRALSAGVDSVEHGASLSDEDIEMMAERGVFYVMTYDAVNATAVSGSAPAHLRDKARSMIESYAVTLPKIKKAGIVIGVGGDSHGFEPAAEANALIANGFTHEEALAALTVNGAVICNMPEKGQIHPGFIADLVALDGNPLEETEALCKVKGVMKAGLMQT